MQLALADATSLPFIMAMKNDCIAEMRARGIEQWDDVYPSREIFETDIAAKNLFVLMDDSNTIIGSATFDEKQSDEYKTIDWKFRSSRIGVVHRLMIAPNHAGKGRAKTLMMAIESEAVRRGYEVIRLDAFQTNPPALRLYESIGYRRTGQVFFRKGVFVCFEKRLINLT